MFNKDFYPTPESVVLESLAKANFDITDKVVLEPSAGKGNAVEVLKRQAHEVIACEKNPDLAEIVSSKADRFLKQDFFEVEAHEISHVDLIWMNPPFSADENHILHAWDILPEGGCLISLCNWNTIDNIITGKRRKISQILHENGSKFDLGDCFSDSERKTSVDVGMFVVRKEKSSAKDEFEGYFDLEEENQVQGIEGIMSHDVILEYVNRYVGAVKMYDSVMERNKEINSLISPIAHGDHSFEFGVTDKRSKWSSVTRDSFKKELQKGAWKRIFHEMKLEKYLTKKSMADINKFVETQQHVPFTRKNIYKMFEIIVGTAGNRMKCVIVEVFDSITRTAWGQKDEENSNRYYHKDKWKTNSEYIVNKKFIMGSMDFRKENNYHTGVTAYPNYHSSNYFMDDLCKAMCYVTGTNFNDMDNWWEWCTNQDHIEEKVQYKDKDTGEQKFYTTKNRTTYGREFGQWNSFNFFDVKMYKKGTMHVKFKSDSDWVKFNRTAAEYKGFQLASQFTGNFRKKKTDVDVA